MDTGGVHFGIGEIMIERAKNLPKQLSLAFGNGRCAMCLDHAPSDFVIKQLRAPVMDQDVVLIPGGYQHFHWGCWLDLVGDRTEKIEKVSRR